MRGIKHIGVVVPAKDEERLLPACLAAVAAAADHVTIPVTVVVVLDACSDHSDDVIHEAMQRLKHIDLQAVAITANSVGAARRIGMEVILDRYPTEGLWLATTDADSVVPPRWLQAQVAHATDGARIVVGTIAVTDWHEHSPAVRDRAIADYTATHHRHVHGANLSFAADAYLTVGGFTDRRRDEDVALVQAFAAAGESIAWALDLAVATSARRKSRAPSGFAAYLLGLESHVTAR